MAAKTKRLPRIGWREWLSLPELGPSPMKAKIDTGARTSALHAFDLRVSEVDGSTVASFVLHPVQRSSAGAVRVEYPVVGFRRVRSSNGRSESRPVIRTRAKLDETIWTIEITLTSRDEMGFRMLLGRSALRRRFVVDPGRSFLAGRPPASQTGRKGTKRAKKAATSKAKSEKAKSEKAKSKKAKTKKVKTTKAKVKATKVKVATASPAKGRRA